MNEQATTARGEQPGAPMSLVDGVDLLAEFSRLAGERDRLVRDAIHTLGRANRAGVVETIEGLPMDLWLAIGHGMNAAERSMLLTASDVLTQMPALDQAWAQGAVSWSVVRDIVGQVRSLGRDGRGVVDARLAASGDLLGDLDPDQISWAVADAVEAFRGAREKQKDEATAARESFLAFQMRIDGGSRVFGELDFIDTAIVTGVLDGRSRELDLGDRMAATTEDGGRDTDADDPATPPPPSPGPGSADRFDRPGHGFGAGAKGAPSADDRNSTPPAPSRPAPRRSRKRRMSLAQKRARALVDLCRRPGPHTKATRPLLVVHVPLDRVTATATGMLEVAVPGLLPRLSAATVDNLTRDADVKAVLFDGAQPLHVTRKTRAPNLPDDIRLAVNARDLGARDPAGRTTIPLSHVHHLTVDHDDDTAGPNHHPDNVVTISPRGHLRVIHRHGWTGRVDPVDAAVTWTRHRPTGSDHTIITRPWGTPLKPATGEKRHQDRQPR